MEVTERAMVLGLDAELCEDEDWGLVGSLSESVYLPLLLKTCLIETLLSNTFHIY